jgi:LmbE family N-acetylglucosaminyl deacetylase
MRRVLAASLSLMTLTRVDFHRSKALLRRLAISLCRVALKHTSQPYELRPVRCVVFAPHQDDETLGCGGLIARKRNEGLPVDVVFLTDGSASHPHHPTISPADVVAIRHREAREALAILGVESSAIHFLNEPDGMLNHLGDDHRAALVQRLTRLLRHIQPHEIFLPCNPDGSTEHDAAFAFIAEAVFSSKLRPAIWQYPVWSWYNPMLLIERMIFTSGRCRVPTEDYQLIKTSALACYRSQTHPMPPQLEPALPPELVQIFNSEVEYFFRFELPSTGARFDSSPPIL